MKFTTFSAAAILAGSADAFWRMECRSQSALARLDPLVDPGKIGAHAHTIFGSSGFSSTSNSDDLLAGDCTSCAVTQDKSAYWTPPMYFKNAATGKFEIVNQVGGMLAYYFLNYADAERKIVAFPHGFEMIAGDANLRNKTGDTTETQFGRSQKAVGFNCLNYGKNPEGSLYRHSMPDKAFLDANCNDGIRAELMFPSCWNGKDVTSANKRDHVAYASSVMDGRCPDDFPIQLPGLFFETIWDTAAFRGIDGEFIFSNGDPTGYGYHGDFIMGWEAGVLQKAVDTCTNISGLISDCPVFNIQKEAEWVKCKATDSALASILSAEDLKGPMDSLPGGVKVHPGPEYVVKPHVAPPAAPAAPVLPSVPYSAGSTVQPSQTILPGGVFNEVSVNEAVAAVEPVAAPEPTEPPKLVLEDNQKLYTTKYKTEGGSIVEVVVIEEVTTVTDKPITKTVTMERRHHAHAHHHARRS